MTDVEPFVLTNAAEVFNSVPETVDWGALQGDEPWLGDLESVFLNRHLLNDFFLGVLGNAFYDKPGRGEWKNSGPIRDRRGTLHPLISHPLCPPTLLDFVVLSILVEARVCAARNPQLSVTQAGILLMNLPWDNLAAQQLVDNLFANNALTEGAILHVANMEALGLEALALLAQRLPAADRENLIRERIGTHRDSRRWQTAARVTSDPHLLGVLGEDETLLVRFYVAGNPATDSVTIARLCRDASTFVRARAAGHPVALDSDKVAVALMADDDPA